jgi:hypothetical protein
MQDVSFARAVFNAIPDNHSYLEIVVHGGQFMIQPLRLLLPGEGDIAARWKNILEGADPQYFGPSGSQCFVIEGKEVDLEDKQDPFYLKARAVIMADQVTAVVERWIG